MKKTVMSKMTLHRETLRQMDKFEHRRLAEIAGGYFPVTTVKPYPCQPSCLC